MRNDPLSKKAARTSSTAAKKAARDALKQTTLAQLDQHEKIQALDTFAVHLEKYMRGGQGSSREQVMTETGNAIGKTFDVRQFDPCLNGLYRLGVLRFSPRRVADYEERIKREYNFPHVTVVGGDDRLRFGRAGAEVLFKQMRRIGALVKKREPKNRETDGSLLMGLVSGSNTASIVDAIDASESLIQDFGVVDLPRVMLFGINSGPTLPGSIRSNATILVARLAAALQSRGIEAVAYGLNAPIVLNKKQVEEIDQTPQTRDVLRFTEPERVANPPLEHTGDTRLDIILTGAGELSSPHSSGSIFQYLAEGIHLDTEKLRREQGLVGDLAFAPLSATGEEVDLTDADGEKYVFYSAASLKVFQRMAADPNKAVILAGQSGKKWRIISASIGSAVEPRHRYVNHLVIDQAAAENLFRYGAES